MKYQAPAIEYRRFVAGWMVTISDGDGGEPVDHCEDGHGNDLFTPACEPD